MSTDPKNSVAGRYRRVGLRPDSPSADGTIHRVLSSFEIHRRA